MTHFIDIPVPHAMLCGVAAAECFAWEHGCERIEIASGDNRPKAHAFVRQLAIGSTLVDSSNRVRDVELASLMNALFSIFYKEAIS
jgi:hypothetical protein